MGKSLVLFFIAAMALLQFSIVECKPQGTFYLGSRYG
nr:venom polypeptide precursor [Doratifera vulnerans]